MDLHEIHLPDNHRDVVSRFLAACQADERIVAAFLGGSYAKDKTDKFSEKYKLPGRVTCRILGFRGLCKNTPLGWFGSVFLL